LAQAASQLVFTFSVGRDVFVEIAKLRAARLTWAKVMATCGADAASQVMLIDARTSLRTKTQRDPWVNMLRDTGECFSAAVGGADVITALPFDELLGQSDDFGARMARNTQQLLRYESNVHRVVDPAGGSWYVEAITDGLARKAWEKLSTFEKAGGFVKVLLGGSLQQELAQALEAERKAVETRKLAITGVNEFPHVKEEPLARAQADLSRAAQRAKDAEAQSQTALSHVSFSSGKLVEQAIQAVAQGAAFASVRAAMRSGTPAQAPALLRERLSQPFERLRDAADHFAAKTGKRPAVFLANLGSIPEHKARAGFAQNYLEAGGFATLGNDGFASADDAAEAFAKSGAEIAVLCSSDAVYAELAGPAARAIQAKSAKAIVLAGNPGPAEPGYREAGVTDFIFVGTNVVQALRSLLERVGAV
jgi:methylmalonyl-CoA mutase